jgi:hypothetical protein
VLLQAGLGVVALLAGTQRLAIGLAGDVLRGIAGRLLLAVGLVVLDIGGAGRRQRATPSSMTRAPRYIG